MGEIDAAGEIVTGALLGRAVEPHAGEEGGHGAVCLNCGTALIGSHCHACGQSAHVHRTLHEIGHEILHGVFHFEGKLWRTLPLLAWRPGELTRRYVAGERARFVSPMALFLFSVFAMFAVFSWTGVTPGVEMNVGAGNPEMLIEEARASLQVERQATAERLEKRDAADPRRAKLAARIAEIDARLAQLPPPATHPNGAEAHGKKGPNTGWATLDHGIEKWQKNPALMLYKLQSSSYKFSWLLIPLSLPFLWLLFAWRREFHLYDHAVFITYSIAFMSLLYIALSVAGALGAPDAVIATTGVLVPLVHVTRQLKQAYGLSWWMAILRTVVLTIFIGIVLALFLLILLAMGMFG